jgi:NAD(P)-dependent dehydrogenase (short-subunit alcohol dehydrogenase family)
MSGRLAGRRALVTGAASGIGRATAARLGRDGARVFGVDVTAGCDLVADVSADAEAIVAAAAEALGGLDILVNNAGVSGFEPFTAHGDDVWDRMLAVNLSAVFRLSRAAVPLLRASRAGRIVNVGSVMSSFGAAGLAAYTASKHGVLGLTRALATELGPDGITVNCVQPGAIETGMTAPTFAANPEFAQYWRGKAALKRLGQPDDVAAVIAFLSGDDAGFVSGHGIFVDGGAMQHS